MAKRRIYRGWIHGEEKDAPALRDLGVKLGAWDEHLKAWLNCEVTPDVLDKLDSRWGQFVWGLDVVEVAE